MALEYIIQYTVKDGAEEQAKGARDRFFAALQAQNTDRYSLLFRAVERETEDLMGASRVDDSGGSIPGMSTEEPAETAAPVEAGSDD